jgi:hypothetical protein
LIQQKRKEREREKRLRSVRSEERRRAAWVEKRT